MGNVRTVCHVCGYTVIKMQHSIEKNSIADCLKPGPRRETEGVNSKLPSAFTGTDAKSFNARETTALISKFYFVAYFLCPQDTRIRRNSS